MAIEAIWEELLRSEEDIESPAWHLEALKETEKRVAAGLEEPIDWEQAKEKLRREFEWNFRFGLLCYKISPGGDGFMTPKNSEWVIQGIAIRYKWMKLPDFFHA